MDAIPKFDHQGRRITNIQICIYTNKNTNTNTNTKEKLQWWIDGCHPQVWPSGTAHYDRSPLEVLSNFPKPHKFPRSDRLDYKFGNIYILGREDLYYGWNDCNENAPKMIKLMVMMIYQRWWRWWSIDPELSEIMFCPHEFNISGPAGRYESI